MNEVIKLLLSHRSVRKYTDRPIPRDVLDELIRCGQAAATSSFIQACTVIQVEDTGKREQLVGLTGNQDYVASAARFLVYCADMNRLKLACDMHEADTKTIGDTRVLPHPHRRQQGYRLERANF